MRSQLAIDEHVGRLYEEARRRLLRNEPLRGEIGESTSPLSVGELDALHAVGLRVTLWKGSTKQDPLTQSVTDYMALLETCYTTSKAAKLLKVDSSRIRRRLRARSLYAIDYGGKKCLPRFQFTRSRVVPGLPKVLAALPKELSPLALAEWFLSPNPDLEIDSQEMPLSPRQWLLKGRAAETVVKLAQGFE